MPGLSQKAKRQCAKKTPPGCTEGMINLSPKDMAKEPFRLGCNFGKPLSRTFWREHQKHRSIKSAKHIKHNKHGGIISIIMILAVAVVVVVVVLEIVVELVVVVVVL